MCRVDGAHGRKCEVEQLHQLWLPEQFVQGVLSVTQGDRSVDGGGSVIEVPVLAIQQRLQTSCAHTASSCVQAAASETSRTEGRAEQASVSDPTSNNGSGNGAWSSNGSARRQGTRDLVSSSNGTGAVNGAGGTSGSNGTARETAVAVADQLAPVETLDSVRGTDVTDIDGYMDPCDTGNLAACASDRSRCG